MVACLDTDRLNIPGAINHVITRGLNRQDIFECRDKQGMLPIEDVCAAENLSVGLGIDEVIQGDQQIEYHAESGQIFRCAVIRNLLGEHGFSDKKLQNSVGIKPPKTLNISVG